MPRLKGQGWRKGRMGEIRGNDLHIRCRIDLSRTRVSLPTQRANNRKERESQLPRFVYLLFCTPLIHPCSTVHLFLRVASVHLHVSLLPIRYSFPLDIPSLHTPPRPICPFTPPLAPVLISCRRGVERNCTVARPSNRPNNSPLPFRAHVHAFPSSTRYEPG